MRTAPIGELTKSVSTWNPSRSPNEAFLYVDLSAVDNVAKVISAATTVIGDEAPSRARQLVAAGDVLVSTVRPNLNAVAVVPPELDGATASTGFTVLRPADNLDGRYLFQWVRSQAFIADMVRNATGASYPAVSDRIVKGSMIPAPRIEEQRRIVAILDHADALRAKRRSILAHLGTLTQAFFHDMFGEVRERVPFSSLVESFRYGTSNKAGESGQPTLRIPNVIGGALNTDEIKTVNVTKSEFDRLRLREGDLLFVRSNGNPDNVGRCAEFGSAAVRETGWPVDRWIYASYLIRARLTEDQQPIYIASYLASSTGRQQLRDRSKTSAGQYNINIDGLGSVKIPAAPLQLQHEFARRVGAVNAQRTAVLVAQAADNELFASLQARAFRGEL